MKKRFVLVLILTVLLTGVVFASSTVGLKDLIKEIDSNRHLLVREPDYVEKFMKEYSKFNSDYNNSITREEAQALITVRERKNSVSYKEAVEDVDLYFRMLRYRLGHYQIVGGDPVFNKSKAEVLNVLKAYEKSGTVRTEDIASILIEKLPLIDDCHFSIDRHSVFYDLNSDAMCYRTYHSGLFLEKDSNGYYLTENKTKYYFQQTDEAISVINLLCEDGSIKFTPVLYSTKNNKPQSSTLVFTSGKKQITKKIEWQLSQSPSISGGYGFRESENIAYIDLRGCGAEVESYLRAAALKAKEKDIVIVDLRTNGGTHAYEFVPNYVGCDVSLNEVALGRVGMTNDPNMRPGDEYIMQMEVSGTGKVVDCKNLTIVLVDNNTGCAPEEFSQYFRFIKNSVVVGTNTKGHLDGGTITYGSNSPTRDLVYMHLPNTGMEVVASTCLALYGDYESMVGKGFKPDIYVENTEDALDYVIAMLNREGLLSENDLKAFSKIEYEDLQTTDLETVLKYLVQEGLLTNVQVEKFLSSRNASEVTKVDSEYGTYYEFRTTLTPENPSASFIFNKDTEHTYRVEFSSLTDSYLHFDLGIDFGRGGAYGGDIFGGEMKWTENIAPHDIKLTGMVSSSNIDKPCEVVVYFFPSEYKNGSGNMRVSKSLMPLAERLDKYPNTITNVYDFGTGWGGSFEIWPYNYFK